MGVYYVHHFGVYLHTGVGVIVCSCERVISGTSNQRMSKDKGSTLVFMYGLVGTAARKNIKHNEQTIYLVYMSAVQFSAHGRPTDGSAPVLW